MRPEVFILGNNYREKGSFRNRKPPEKIIRRLCLHWNKMGKDTPIEFEPVDA